MDSSLYSFELDNSGVKKALEERKNYPVERNLLADILLEQNKKIASEATLNNIDLLRLENTYTITTGHQLCLMGGPSYFFHKIISVIQLCKQLKKEYSEYNFVPIFWMASEDHDFEEINHFYLFNRKYEWETHQKGKVGMLDLESLQPVLARVLKDTKYASNPKVIQDIVKLYQKATTLSEATRFLANYFFKDDGLVIIDADHKDLKSQIKEQFIKEINENSSYHNIKNTINTHFISYKAQVEPREINLFYMHQGIRERIIKEQDIFQINNTSISFSQAELEELIQNYPERISPNVVLRPIYQELILPNIAYVGGNGECSYWLELKSAFDAYNAFYPMLIVRQNYLYMPEVYLKKIEELKLDILDFLKLSSENIYQKWLHQKSNFSLANQQEKLNSLIKEIEDEIRHFNTEQINTLRLYHHKLQKAIQHIEKKILGQDKLKHQKVLKEISQIKQYLFPLGKLQERHTNFLEHLATNNLNDWKLLNEKTQQLKGKVHFYSFES